MLRDEIENKVQIEKGKKKQIAIKRIRTESDIKIK